MKKIIPILALLLSALPSIAQITHSTTGRTDDRATSLLHNAAARFQQNVSFNVHLTISDSHGQQIGDYSATVQYNRGKYHLTMPEQQILSDGTTVWQWNTAANEVAINNVSNDDIDLLNPGQLLANYSRSFRAKYIRTDNNGLAVIDMQPLSAQSYHKIRLLIHEKNGLLHRIEVHRYDSGRELYDISDFHKTSTPNSQFTFDPTQHPGVEIIDMR